MCTYLVKIGQRVRISRQLVIDGSQPVTCSKLSESDKINNVERADMVWLAAQVVLPVALAPKLESECLLAHRKTSIIDMQTQPRDSTQTSRLVQNGV